MFKSNNSNQYFYIDMSCPIESYPFTIFFDRYWTGESTTFGFGWCENAPANPYKTIRIQNASVSASKGRQQINIGGTAQPSLGQDVTNTYSRWIFNLINTSPGSSNLYRNNTTRLTSLQTGGTFATLPITGLTRFWVGYGPWTTTTYFAGYSTYSNITVWNKTLSLDEINSLMKGICPIKVAPSNVRFYLPLNNGPHPRIEWISGKSLINVNGMSEIIADPITFYDGKINTKMRYGSIVSPPEQNIQYGSTTFYINNNIYTPSFLNMYGSLEFKKDSILHSSYNRIMNGRIDFPNDIIIYSSANKVINGVGIFSGNVDISTTYKRIMSGNSVLSSITELSNFPSLIINPQLSFQNKNSITGIGSLLIKGGTIPLNTSSDLNLTIQRLLSGNSIIRMDTGIFSIPHLEINSNVSPHINGGISSTTSRILNPNLTIDTTSTTNNVGRLIMSGYSSINSNSNISPSTTRIMSSVINLINDGYLDNNPYITMNAIQKFISEENLTIIPSLIFNSRVGIENISEFNSIPTRIISSNQTIQSKSSIQNICSLIMNGMFGADNDSILDGVLTPVDTGETLLGTSILQTLSHLGLNASLHMEGSVDLGNNLNTFLSSNRIILPVVELRNNTSIESNPHSIINSVVDMEAFGKLSPASQRIINGRFEVGSEGRIIGNPSRIIQSELELNAYTEFLNSSTRIHTGMLVLSNDSSFDSVGNRVISGVMVYDIDSYINSTGQSVLTGQLNLQTSTLLDSSIIKLVFIPFTMNICKEYDINLQNSTTKTFQFSINREKEIVLNIRKE